jgi:tetratricopeptide (TPR) repeat protein
MFKSFSFFLVSFTQYLVIALMALLPIIFFPFPWATVPHAKMTTILLFVVVALGVWIAVHIAKGSVAIPLSPIIAAAALLPLAYAISALVSGGTSSFVGSGVERDTLAAMMLWFAGMATVAAVLSSGRVAVRAYQALLAAAGIVALFHLARIIFGPVALLFGGVLTGPAASVVGSWHDLGIFLGLGIILASAALGSTLVAGFARWLTVSVLGISTLVLVVINERDVWISLAVVSAITMLYLWFSMRYVRDVPAAVRSRWKFALVLSVGIFVMAALLSFLTPYVYSVIPERFQVAQVEVRPSWRGTAAVGSAIYQERSILFGSGPNTFVREWGNYKPAGVNETAFWNADFLQGVGFIPTSVATTGLVGLIAWGIFLLALLYGGFRSIFSIMVPQWRMPLFALFAGAVYLWTMHIIYPPGTMLLALAFLLTGVFVASQRASGAVRDYTWEYSRTPVAGFVVSGALIVMGLATLIAAVGVGRALAADMFVNRSITVYNGTQDFSRAQQGLQTALFLKPGSNRALRAAVELNLLRFVSLTYEGSASETQQEQLRGAIEQAIQNGLSAVSADSTNYQNWLSLARVYEQLVGAEVEGAYENARQAYERAAALNPTNPAPYLQLARLASGRGDMEAARISVHEALARKSNYAAAYLLLSQIEVAEDNLEAARTAAALAVQSAPEDPVSWFQLGVLLYSTEDYQTSANVLEQAVLRNGNYANALYVLGLAYYRMGQTDGALAALERVRALNPENEIVTALMEEIRTAEATSPEGEQDE